MRTSYLLVVVTVFVIFLVQFCLYVRPTFLYGKKKSTTPKYVRSVTYKCADLGGDPPKELVPGIKFILYIISHDDASHETALKWSTCKPWAKVVRIPTTVYFESIVYKEILPGLESEWSEMDFVGISTYRSLKFSPMDKIKTLLTVGHHVPYDVVPLFSTGEYLIDQAVAGHTIEYIHIWDMLLQHMGYKEKDIRNNDKIEVFLRNSMLIRPNWLKKLSNFMINSINEVNNNKTLHTKFATDAHYYESKYRKKVSERVFHTKYYQWHPFIFERLPVFYLNYHNASIYNTLYDTEWFDFKDSTALFDGL